MSIIASSKVDELLIPSSENELDLLESNLQKLAIYLPALEIQKSNKNNFSLSELDLIFDTIAFSFSFDEEIQNIIKNEKGSDFHFYAPPLSGNLEERARSCNKLLKAILPKVNDIYDKNLMIFWSSLVKTQSFFPKNLANLSAPEIRAWMSSEKNQCRFLQKVEVVDLKTEPLEILPPEANLLLNLKKIELASTKILDYPHALDNHPNSKKLVINVDTDHFTRFGEPFLFS